MATILAMFNIKGGVGKTSSAVNLAFEAAKEGKTLIWDLDPQGAASFYLKVKPEIKGGIKNLIADKKETIAVIKGTEYEDLDILPADKSYRQLELLINESKSPAKFAERFLKPLAKHYDYIIIDCPPILNKATESVMKAVDLMLVPTIPTTLSLRTLEQVDEYVNKNLRGTVNFKAFFTLVDRRKSMHADIINDYIAKRLKKPFFRSTIPYNSAVEKMGIQQAPLGEFAASSDAYDSYMALWKEIKRALKAQK